MLGSFQEIKENKAIFADSPLGRKADGVDLEKFANKADQPLAIMCEAYKNCPVENGEWSDERGDSQWKPDKDYVPQKSNPDGKSWGKILNEHGIDHVDFKDGEPDFDRISKGNVEIKDFTDSRTDNFDQADIELAAKKGCSPSEVKEWRKENGFTWHECKDTKTMQKVPGIVHNNIPHSGGISEVKKGA